MPPSLRKGDSGSAVKQLQRTLAAKSYLTKAAVDGVFGIITEGAVRLFQARSVDQHGQPLVVDGRVGPLTWRSLLEGSVSGPRVQSPITYDTLPPRASGGSVIGRATLAAAIGELRAGAGERNGNNKGPFVKKYLSGASLPEGNPWCASFVSWCMLQAVGGDRAKMPVKYCPLARGLLSEFRKKGWASAPSEAYLPVPGDLVFWWREARMSPLGHVGLVHSLKDGMLYTIEGNRTPQVQGFSYVVSRMERLLGFGHVPPVV